MHNIDRTVVSSQCVLINALTIVYSHITISLERDDHWQPTMRAVDRTIYLHSHQMPLLLFY